MMKPLFTEKKLEATNERASKAEADRLVKFLRSYGETRINSRLNDERRTVQPHIILDLAREGLFGLQIPKKYGGLELTYKDTFRVLQQLVAIDTNVALLVAVHYAIGTPPIANFASEEARAKILPSLARGQSLATIACTEPGAGANLKAISTRAQKQTDGSYILNGKKSWISLGSWAEYVTVIAQVFDVDGTYKGISAFLVKQGTPGFIPGTEAMTFGMKGLPQNHINIHNLKLPASALLGKEGQGDKVAQKSFMLGRILVAIMGVGAMKRTLQISGRYARRRKVATGNLLSNGFIASEFSDMFSSIHSIESLVHEFSTQMDQGQIPDGRSIIAAKILGGELTWKTVDRCVQILGARGFMDTNIVGQYFRDARLLRIFEGPTESMTSYLGAVVLKNPAQFIGLLKSKSQGEGVAHIFAKTVGHVEAYFSREQKLGTLTAQERQYLMSQMGELGSWALLATNMNATSYEISSQQKLSAIEYIYRNYERLSTQLAQQLENKLAIPDVGSLHDELDALTETIGDVEQHMVGEEIPLDETLLR